MRKLLLLVVVMSVAVAVAAQQVPDAPQAAAPAAALPAAPSSTPAGSNAAASQGNWEIGVTTGGGHSVAGGTSDTGVFNANVRFGYVLTHEHGPGGLRGTFEYAAEVTPVNLIFQPLNTAYGFSFTPVLLKWNFTSGEKLVPYVEAGAGVLFTNNDVPSFTNSVNFTPQAALGLQYFHRPDRAVSLAFRYEHISNAGLATPNPGINTLQFTLGYHWWKRH